LSSSRCPEVYNALDLIPIAFLLRNSHASSPDGKGFPLLQANPQTDKRCIAAQTADSLSNGWNAQSIFKGCLSGLIFSTPPLNTSIKRSL